MLIEHTAIGSVSLGHKMPLLINFYEDVVVPAAKALPAKVVILAAMAPLILFYVAVGAVEMYIEDA